MLVKHNRYRNNLKGPCLWMEYTFQPLSLHSKCSRKLPSSSDTVGNLDWSEEIFSRIIGVTSRPRMNHWSPVRDGNWQNLCHVSRRQICGCQMSCLIWEYWSEWTRLGVGWLDGFMLTVKNFRIWGRVLLNKWGMHTVKNWRQIIIYSTS